MEKEKVVTGKAKFLTKAVKVVIDDVEKASTTVFKKEILPLPIPTEIPRPKTSQANFSKLKGATQLKPMKSTNPLKMNIPRLELPVPI